MLGMFYSLKNLSFFLIFWFPSSFRFPHVSWNEIFLTSLNAWWEPSRISAKRISPRNLSLSIWRRITWCGRMARMLHLSDHEAVSDRSLKVSAHLISMHQTPKQWVINKFQRKIKTLEQVLIGSFTSVLRGNKGFKNSHKKVRNCGAKQSSLRLLQFQNTRLLKIPWSQPVLLNGLSKA